MKQIIKQTTTPSDWSAWETDNAANLTAAISGGNTGTQIWNMGKQDWGFNTDNIFKKILIKEQYFICCYCNCRIEIDSQTSLEHFKPKNIDSYKRDIFKYHNLYAVCKDGERDVNYDPRDIHCDSEGAKGGKDPVAINIIEPNNASCETFFKYNINGCVTGTTPEAQNTIRELRLDCVRLVTLRKRIIQDYFEINPDSEADDVLQPYEDVDGYEKLQPFCIAIAQNA